MVTQQDFERLKRLYEKEQDEGTRESLAKALKLFSGHLNNLGPHQQIIVDTLLSAGRPMSTADIVAAVGINEEEVEDSISRLKARGHLVRMRGDSRHSPCRYAPVGFQRK